MFQKIRSWLDCVQKVLVANDDGLQKEKFVWTI